MFYYKILVLCVVWAYSNCIAVIRKIPEFQNETTEKVVVSV